MNLPCSVAILRRLFNRNDEMIESDSREWHTSNLHRHRRRKKSVVNNLSYEQLSSYDALQKWRDECGRKQAGWGGGLVVNPEPGLDNPQPVVVIIDPFPGYHHSLLPPSMAHKDKHTQQQADGKTGRETKKTDRHKHTYASQAIHDFEKIKGQIKIISTQNNLGSCHKF